MLVQAIYKNGNRQVSVLVNNKQLCMTDAIALSKQFENVVLVGNRYFRSRKGCEVPIVEVKDNVKRSRSSRQQVQRGQMERDNQRRFDSNVRSSKDKQVNDVSRKRVSECVKQSELRRPSRNSSGIESSLSLRLRKLSCVEYTITDASIFKKRFDNAREFSPNKDCVDVHDVSQLREMTCLSTKNGFVAVEKDGNITSVLRDESLPRESSFLRDLMINAIAHGAYKLDCFAVGLSGGLANLYSKVGFVPVVRDHFNRDFAPDGWDYEKYGEPDVVFMYHCGDSIEEVVRKSAKGEYKCYNDYDVPYIEDIKDYYREGISSYDQAFSYRDVIIYKRMRFNQ